MAPTATEESALSRRLEADGHVFVAGTALRPRLLQAGSLADWEAFAASWATMPVDGYMADGGRYRRRRHAVFAVDAAGRIERQAHQPHYQSREYNTLNGGIARWFEPITADGDSLRTVLAFCAGVFGTVAVPDSRWRVEVHQFRIEARPGETGRPTPEGVHRDGVDHVLVLLVTRHNIARGVTEIFDPAGRPLGSFTLTAPFDAVLLDDHRVHHGVTAVEPLDPSQPAWRDVLVVTFQREAAATGA